ncbi:MAG: copper homeostasis protein CutC [Bacteroidales bacterium]|nr:copper homeostasis protein CutC [Bacteroidales bacterium]
MEFILEICVDSVESALNAEKGGAHRIELCSALPEGGITPSQGLIKSVKRNTGIPVHVLIRPRSGDFCYDDHELDIMRSDIEFCGEAGIDGIVTGILSPDGSVDTARCSILRESAGSMSFTFHRAFDLCDDPVKGLSGIIETGADRILTSGQAPSAHEGIELIKKLIVKAADRIVIMPGGKINETNIAAIARETGAREFHMSAAKEIIPGKTYSQVAEIINGRGFRRQKADIETIRKIREILNSL